MPTRHELAFRASFARRVWEAYQDLLKTRRDVTQTRLGELVGAWLGIEPIRQASVSRWMADEPERVTLPDVMTVQAIAAVLGVRPAWLAWGEQPMEAPGTPEVVPPPDRVTAALRADEAAREVRRQQREAPPQDAPARPARRRQGGSRG